jgi:hypothetical protein
MDLKDGRFKRLDVLTEQGLLKADSVFDLSYVAEQPQGCHNIDLRLLAQARLAYEAKIVLRTSLQHQRANGEEAKDVHDWSIYERPLLPQLGQRDTLD